MIDRFSRTASESRRDRRGPSRRTFPEDLPDPAGIEAGVIEMADDVWRWCEKTHSRGRTVTVKIKWPDFQISTRSRSMETAIATREKLHEVALDLIRSAFPQPKGIRLVCVTLLNFARKSPAKDLNSLLLKSSRRNQWRMELSCARLTTSAPPARADRTQNKRQARLP
jgi:hypothetical protein